MSKLLQLPLIGRLGNLLFQYAHARAFADANGYDLCLHPWVGERIFAGVPQAVRPGTCTPDLVWPERLYQHQNDLNYTRKQVREWFKLKPEIKERLEPARARHQVILNVRQGKDYRDAGLVTLSKECYGHACRLAGYDTLEALFETDLNPTSIPGFDGDFSSSGHCVSEVVLPSFFRLLTAQVLFRANSTFSWWAATLADRQTVYAPIIKGLPGTPDVYCSSFTNGNWPAMVDSPDHSDLHLPA